ncbi:hypothetical protein TIFTF001_002056 [Ficus carica]|uniref:Uncharacterized protein n=1 Tax=Ficus carica TaxID=3494 RepID=A0AA87Z8Z7_FICCA|nr:hypothetical protein TIFTF001_002056 [Ficus carica]
MAKVDPPKKCRSNFCNRFQYEEDKDLASETAIYGMYKAPYLIFPVFNTLAVSSCLVVISCLTHKFPYYMEICVASISMFAISGSPMFAVTPPDAVKFRSVLLAAMEPLLLRLLEYWLDPTTAVVDADTRDAGQRTESPVCAYVLKFQGSGLKRDKVKK